MTFSFYKNKFFACLAGERGRRRYGLNREEYITLRIFSQSVRRVCCDLNSRFCFKKCRSRSIVKKKKTG